MHGAETGAFKTVYPFMDNMRSLLVASSSFNVFCFHGALMLMNAIRLISASSTAITTGRLSVKTVFYIGQAGTQEEF